MALDRDEVLAGLVEIVNDVAGVPAGDITPEKSFVDELDVDSLALVEIIAAAEERFEITVPDEDARNFKTIGDAVDFIVLHSA